MKVRLLWIGLVLAAGGTVAWYSWRWYAAPTPPEVALDGVDRLTADAVREALNLVRDRPRSGEAWGELAMLLAANGFHEHVPHCYSLAERFDPDNPAWPYLHGVHLAELDPEQAVPLLRKAVTLSEDPAEQAAMHFRLAQIHIEHDRLLEAEPHVQALGKLELGGSRVRWMQGLLAVRRDDKAAARVVLGSLMTDPFARKRALPLLLPLIDKELGQRLQEQGSRLPADLAWPDPLHTWMQSHRVNRLGSLAEYFELDKGGRRQEALSHLRALVAKAPDAEVCFTLGYALYKLNELEEAEAMLRIALRYDPKNVKTHSLIASCLLLRGESLDQQSDGKEKARTLFGEAVAAANETLALHPEHGLTHMTRGWALKHLGRTEEALTALGRAVDIQPDFADAHFYLGQTLVEAGRLDEALPHLQNSVRFARPDDVRPSEALARLRAKLSTAPKNDAFESKSKKKPL